jgi:hypothetical protein
MEESFSETPGRRPSSEDLQKGRSIPPDFGFEGKKLGSLAQSLSDKGP